MVVCEWNEAGSLPSISVPTARNFMPLVVGRLIVYIYRRFSEIRSIGVVLKPQNLFHKSTPELSLTPERMLSYNLAEQETKKKKKMSQKAPQREKEIMLSIKVYIIIYPFPLHLSSKELKKFACQEVLLMTYKVLMSSQPLDTRKHIYKIINKHRDGPGKLLRNFLGLLFGESYG